MYLAMKCRLSGAFLRAQLGLAKEGFLHSKSVAYV